MSKITQSIKVENLEIGEESHTVEWQIGAQFATCTCSAKRHPIKPDGCVEFCHVPCPRDGRWHGIGILHPDGHYEVNTRNCWY